MGDGRASTNGASGGLQQELIAERLRTVGVSLAIIAVSVQTVLHLANALVFNSRFEPLDAGFEGNTFTWASSVAVFGAALAMVIFALVFPQSRGSSLLLAAILAFFSLDDVVQVHEMVGWDFATGLGMPEYLGGRLFLILYAPLFALAAILLWKVGRRAHGWSSKAIIIGLALLVLAIGGEGLGGVLQFATDGDFADSAAHDLEIAFEEGAELGGWILIATALAAALAVRIGDTASGHFDEHH